MFSNTSPPRTPPGLFSVINFNDELQNSSQRNLLEDDNNLQNYFKRDLSKDFKLENCNDLKRKLYYFIEIYLEGNITLNITSHSSIPFLIRQFGNNYSIEFYDELIKQIEGCNNPSNSLFFTELNKRIANDNKFKEKTLYQDFSQLYPNNNDLNNPCRIWKSGESNGKW